MTRLTLEDTKNHVQVRTYHYNYTYTFYTIEHALDHFGFDIRYSNIGEGRILAHFDDDNQLIKNRRGHMDLRFEPMDEGTLFKMYSSSYNGCEDDEVRAFRRKILKTFQYWLDSQFTMTLPEDGEGIPRFRPESISRGLLSRPETLERPDTDGLVTQLVFLGTSMMVTGILINAGLGIWSGLMGMQMAILSGLPFFVFAIMLRNGSLRSVVGLLMTVGVLAGLVYITVTAFIGLVLIMLPVAVIYITLREVDVWNGYYERLGSPRMGPDTLLAGFGRSTEGWDKTMAPRKGNGPGGTAMRGQIIY